MEVTCAVCGRTAVTTGAALGWSLDRRRSGDQVIEEWTCPVCSRENARAIEAKLDREWW